MFVKIFISDISKRISNILIKAVRKEVRTIRISIRNIRKNISRKKTREDCPGCVGFVFSGNLSTPAKRSDSGPFLGILEFLVPPGRLL